MLPPGGTIALAEGAYYGHQQLFDHLRPWGVERRRVRPDRASARARRPDPARGAVQPAADDARLRGGRRPSRPRSSATRRSPPRCACGRSSSAATWPLHSATKVLGGPRRPPRRRRHGRRRRPLRAPPPHAPADRPRRLGRHGVAARARAEDARGAARADGGDGARARRPARRAPGRRRPSATRASAS